MTVPGKRVIKQVRRGLLAGVMQFAVPLERDARRAGREFARIGHSSPFRTDFSLCLYAGRGSQNEQFAGKCAVDRATSISARSRSAFHARPERALVRFFEAVDDAVAVRLQRHRLPAWPVRGWPSALGDPVVTNARTSSRSSGRTAPAGPDSAPALRRRPTGSAPRANGRRRPGRVSVRTPLARARCDR